MARPVSDKIYSVEEYFHFENTSERLFEFINSKIYEKESDKDIENEIQGNVCILLYTALKSMAYQVYHSRMKFSYKDNYYYPDVFVTKEEKNENNRYIKYKPEIIVEVVSESSQVTDYVDKYIDYTKIPSLHYYLIIEPETILITVYSRDENNNWIAHKYTRMEDIVKLEKFGFEFAVKDIYK